MASTIGIAGSRTSEDASIRSSARLRTLAIVLGISLLALACVAAILSAKYWPFSEKEVQEDLAEASDSAVTIRSYHPTYFPPGCTLEGIEFHHGPKQFKLITIDKLVVSGSYTGILRRHVPRITAVGAKVFVPPL